jgi:hypothetical protein
MAWFVPRGDGNLFDIYGRIRTPSEVEFFRNNPPVTGIVVDAGVIGGRTYISTYDLDTCIYKVDRLPHRHHSAVAELMAIAKGVSAAKWKHGLTYVHCDNSQAVIWAIRRFDMDPRDFGWLDVMAYNCAMEVILHKRGGVKIRPWYTDNWGENPADYRYRKNIDGFKGFTKPKDLKEEGIRKKKRKRKRTRKNKRFGTEDGK